MIFVSKVYCFQRQRTPAETLDHHTVHTTYRKLLKLRRFSDFLISPFVSFFFPFFYLPSPLSLLLIPYSFFFLSSINFFSSLLQVHLSLIHHLICSLLFLIRLHFAHFVFLCVFRQLVILLHFSLFLLVSFLHYSCSPGQFKRIGDCFAV
jgi:hypothetical protein